MPAALGLVDLGILLALAFLLALSVAYRYSLGAAIIGISRAIGSIRLPGVLGGGRIFGFAADALQSIDDLIRHELGVGINALQATWNEAISYTATVFHWIGKEIADLAYDTASAVEGLAVKQVKPWVAKQLHGALATVAALKARVLVLERQTVALARREAALAKQKAQAVEHAIAVPGTDAIPKAIPRISDIRRAADDALARIRDLTRRVAPAALVGAVVFAAARVGFGWVRCSKVGRVGRQVCGMNDSLLDSLLADTLLIVGTVSLVEFAQGMQEVTEDLAGGVRYFWRA